MTYGPDIRAALVLDDPFLDSYYISLIPKYKYPKPQYYKPHITVVRFGKEFPPNMEKWGVYDNQKVYFQYNTELKEDEKYFWLEADSKFIRKIRIELGLPPYRDGFNCFHITIANKKCTK